MLPYIFATRGQAPGSVLGLFAPLKQRELRSWACQAWQLDPIPGVFNRATPAIVNQTPEQTAPGVRVPREEGVPWHDGGGEGTRTLTALRPTDFKSVYLTSTSPRLVLNALTHWPPGCSGRLSPWQPLSQMNRNAKVLGVLVWWAYFDDRQNYLRDVAGTVSLPPYD